MVEYEEVDKRLLNDVPAQGTKTCDRATKGDVFCSNDIKRIRMDFVTTEGLARRE